jgi:hypothetical protein
MLGTRLRVVHESACPDIGPICAVRSEPPNQHDQVLYIAELRSIFEYAFDDAWGLEAQVPVKLTDTRIVYRRLDGTIFTPDYTTIHHRNETLFGIGDPTLSARHNLRFAGTVISLRAGMSIPLGDTVRDPFLLGEMGLEHQHIQFGTGTFDPLFAFELSRTLGPVSARIHGQTQLILYESQRGFRAGNRYAAGVLASMGIAGPLAVSASFDVINEQPERWSGEIQQDGNLGRTDLLAGGSLILNLGTYDFSAGLRVPIYQHIIMSHDEPGQLTYPALLNFTVSRAFELAL